MIRAFRLAFFLALPALAGFLSPIRADEGMWLFNNPPKSQLKSKYGFEVAPAWLDHLQKSSVRFNSGGSGSFVSADGLVMTNHHVASDALQRMGTKDRNYYRDGFHAKTRAEEFKCEAMELNVLMSIEDVTERVNGAVKAEMKAAEAFAARRAVMAEIEKESSEKTSLRSDVIAFYQGAVYHLYRFKKYTDVRLVFAPEQQIAFYGGDPDNFEYPRFDLDFTFFRVYENNKPARVEHFLKWSKEGAKEGELVFVSGHPGRTNRLNSVAELNYFRDTGYPFLLQRLNRWEVLLNAFSGRSEENARQAKEFLFSVQNSRKARVGGLAGLMDPEMMGKKEAFDARLKEAAAKDEKLKEARGAWAAIEKAEKVRAQLIRPYTVLEGGAGFNSDLFGIARTLVRASEEKPKKNQDRLREFRDSALESLELQLFSEEPVYDEYEIIKLADGLTFLAAELGYKNPVVVRALAGKSPQLRAAELVLNSKLKDVGERKKLYRDGAKAILASKDPMIALAKSVDAAARQIRKRMELEVEEPKRQAYSEIAKVRFALEGINAYPDATFTLRLAYGVVKGYEENGKKIPAETDFAGLYERAAEHLNKPPFDLPPRWVEKKSKLDLKTPFNFVCTADIIGGNSGSPVVNRNAEVVGLIFDGNIQSLVLDFAFTEEQGRAVSVHSKGMIEGLRKIYEAHNVADELEGR
ncbi:MAG: S46 family peptidase [Gemmataceae bacterium]|nr:S46 family peptidase [Gemmataceae bacterium]